MLAGPVAALRLAFRLKPKRYIHAHTHSWDHSFTHGAFTPAPSLPLSPELGPRTQTKHVETYQSLITDTIIYIYIYTDKANCSWIGGLVGGGVWWGGGGGVNSISLRCHTQISITNNIDFACAVFENTVWVGIE